MKLVDKRDKGIIRTAVLGILVIVFFVSIVFRYYNMVYERSNIIKDGKMDASSSAEQFDRYLSTNIDLIKFTAYTLDEMIVEKKSDQEIQEFLVGQSTAIRNAVLENSTGLYGYINGRFFSGTNWEPPEDYDATIRPWYEKPMANPGQLTILEPYVDVQSGNTMLALGKTLCDGVSVLSIDVSLDAMQKLTEDTVLGDDTQTEMILTADGKVVTHSDTSEIGKDYSAETGSLGSEIVSRLTYSKDAYYIFAFQGQEYIVYDAPFAGGWHCISVHEASSIYQPMRRLLIVTIIVVILIVLSMGVILALSTRRRLLTRQAVAENQAKTDFLSRMSHEIRTPINAVLGMNEMILRESKEAQIRSYAEKAKSAGHTLLSLVNDLLDFSGGAAASHRKYTAPKAEILVVDDNTMNLTVFESLLKETKVRIDKAESADEGLALAYRKPYDVIFFDHMMPKKDGIEALRELRENKTHPNQGTPVICLTANAVAGAREEYLEKGFEDYMAKPLDAEKLEALLLRYLPEHKVERVKETEPPVETAPLPSELKTLEDQECIDVKIGLKNSGTAEAYLALLKLFYTSMNEKTAELERFYNAGDIRDYTIKVHALKSSARIIGALSFGEEAQALENAGKSEDMDYIRSHHAGFIAAYQSFREPLEAVFGKEEEDTDKPEADQGLMDRVYGALRAAAEDMDCDRLQGIFQEMERFRIPDKDKTLWRNLKNASDNYDYEAITELLAKEQ